MPRYYPDFIENAKNCIYTNFYHVAKDRWDYFERDGFRKLSTVLQKSKDISWKRLYVYYSDLYITKNTMMKSQKKISKKSFKKTWITNI